jgi:hypothetical protein
MTDTFDDETDSLAAGDNLIRSYGLFWERDAIDWEQEELLGHRRHYKRTSKNLQSKKKECNAWEQRGIYALYSQFKLVYVGMASSSAQGIGSRLHSHHTKARMRGRWDTFSWFGIDSYNDSAVRVPYKEGRVSESTLVRTLELVSILIAAPLLNRAEGKFKGAEQIVQDTSHAKRKPEDLILDEIKSLRDELLKRNHS